MADAADEVGKHMEGDVLPARASLDGPNRKLFVTYKLIKTPLLLDAHVSKDSQFVLNMCNARDLGLKFVSVVPSSLAGLTAMGPAKPGTVMSADHIWKRRQMVDSTRKHANQFLLTQDENVLELRLERLPASLEIRMWKEKPASPTAPPDLTEILTVEMDRPYKIRRR